MLIKDIPYAGIELLTEVDDIAYKIVARFNIKVNLLVVRVSAFFLNGRDIRNRYQKLTFVLKRSIDKVKIIRNKRGI